MNVIGIGDAVVAWILLTVCVTPGGRKKLWRVLGGQLFELTIRRSLKHEYG